MTSSEPTIAAVALSHSPQMAQDTDHVQGTRFRNGFAEVANADLRAAHPTQPQRLDGMSSRGGSRSVDLGYGAATDRCPAQRTCVIDLLNHNSKIRWCRDYGTRGVEACR
jgi:hypothetical protein